MTNRVSALRSNKRLHGVLLTSAMLAIATVPAVAQAQVGGTGTQASREVQFNVPPQELDSALTSIADQGGIHIFFTSADLAGRRTNGVSGRMTVEQALSQALTGSGFGWRYREAGTVIIEKLPEAQGAIQLGPVRVEGAAADTVNAGRQPLTVQEAVTEGTRSYKTNAVTIGKTVLNPLDIPQTVSVVTRQRIEDQNLFTMTEALEATPGVTVQSDGTQRDVYMARGFTISNIQIDGLPTPYYDYIAMSPDLAMYDHVEIIRGANGLLQGTGDPSASINLVRKRPTDTFAANAMVSAGSWNNYRVEGDVGGPIDSSGKLRVRVVGSFQDNDYFYDVAHQRKWLVYGVMDYSPTPTTKITAGYTYLGSKSTPSITGLPTYSDGSFLNVPRSTFLGASWNRFTYNNQEAFVELRQKLGSDWTAQAEFRHANNVNSYYAAYIQGPVNSTTGTGTLSYAIYPDYTDKQDSAEIFLTGPVRLFGRTHTLLFGVTGRDEHFIFNRVQNTTATVDVLNFDPYSVALPDSNWPLFVHYTRNDREAGVYGSARLSITDALTVTLGSRVSWWEERSIYAPPGIYLSSETVTKKYGIFTPYAGAIYKITPSVSLYASYADIFKPQTNLQFGGGEASPLPPIVGANYEAGLKSSLLHDRLSATFALFQIDQRNRALLDSSRACSGPVCYYLPSGKVRSRGFEFEVTGHLAANWQIAVGYTYAETKYLKDTANQGAVFSPFTPKNLFKIWTDYTLPGDLSRWSIGGGVEAQSKVYVVSNSARITQGGYALVGLRASYKPTDKITIAANINNLLDKTYYSGLSSVSGSNFYGEPRSFTISLRTKF